MMVHEGLNVFLLQGFVESIEIFPGLAETIADVDDVIVFLHIKFMVCRGVDKLLAVCSPGVPTI
jgi:hypothetical protein